MLKIYKLRNGGLEKDILLARALRRDRIFLDIHPEYSLSLVERLRFWRYSFLYKKGFSVAAITRRKEFYGLDFYVNRHVLIPRPETELLVEVALAEMSNFQFPMSNLRHRRISLRLKVQNPQPKADPPRAENDKKILLIDVGTGSGCIPISIMKATKYNNVITIATDVSCRALKVAKRNARRHGVVIDFKYGNLLSPVIKQLNNRTIEQLNNVIITANLPYLTAEQYESEPSIQREPKTALVAENGGLALYQKLLQQIKHLQNLLASRSRSEGGLLTPYSLLLLMEIDPSQSQKLASVIKQHFPSAETKIKKDLAGRDRVITVRISSF